MSLSRLFLGLVVIFGGVVLAEVLMSPGSDPEVARPGVRDQWMGDETRPLAAIPYNADEARIGQELFHDVRLSLYRDVSCASCHDLSAGGDDGLVRSLGTNRAEGLINAPTVFNAALNFRQFWDGRADLNAQIDGPIHTAHELGAGWEEVLSRLNSDPATQQKFLEVFGGEGPITEEQVRICIAEFEKSLITPNSRFDQWIGGDDEALTMTEKRGYQKFKSMGCVSCHQGILLGGNMYQKMGIVNDYFASRGNVTEADLGRFNVTGRVEDKYVFKVPSLRNISETAPYMHDGSKATLEEVVNTMAFFQLGRQFDETTVDEIVAFLKTLTGEVPPHATSTSAID